MKVLVVSDTHGKEDHLLEAVRLEAPFDYMIHLGDIGKLEEYIEELTGYPCFAVKGNNDWRSMLPSESIIMIGGKRAFLTHGHHFGVSYGLRDLKRYAENLNCEIAIFGHTHVPELVQERNFTCFCPGSLTYPRQPGKSPSYGVIEVLEGGQFLYLIKYLK